MESIEVSAPGRKRSANYPLAFKRQLAQRACDENVSVAQLALEHGLNTNMVFKRRRELRAGLLDRATALLPVSLTPTRTPDQANTHAVGVIEVRIGAALVRIEGAPDPATLSAVLQSLQR